MDDPIREAQKLLLLPLMDGNEKHVEVALNLLDEAMLTTRRNAVALDVITRELADLMEDQGITEKIYTHNQFTIMRQRKVRIEPEITEDKRLILRPVYGDG